MQIIDFYNCVQRFNFMPSVYKDLTLCHQWFRNYQSLQKNCLNLYNSKTLVGTGLIFILQLEHNQYFYCAKFECLYFSRHVFTGLQKFNLLQNFWKMGLGLSSISQKLKMLLTSSFHKRFINGWTMSKPKMGVSTQETKKLLITNFEQK